MEADGRGGEEEDNSEEGVVERWKHRERQEVELMEKGKKGKGEEGEIRGRRGRRGKKVKKRQREDFPEHSLKPVTKLG